NDVGNSHGHAHGSGSHAHTPLLGGRTSGKSTRSSSIVSSGVPKVKFYLS
ncbi:uncharacterized protein Dwil_GK27295, partial [Drosophila willistoni]